MAAAAGTASLALLWVRRSLARVVGAIGGLLDGVGMVGGCWWSRQFQSPMWVQCQ